MDAQGQTSQTIIKAADSKDGRTRCASHSLATYDDDDVATKFECRGASIWRSKWSVQSSALPRERMTTAIYDGARFTAISSEIKAAITRAALLGLAGIAILALLPLVVRDHLNGGAFEYGVLMAGFGIGAFFAGITAGHFRRRMSQEWLIRLTCLAARRAQRPSRSAPGKPREATSIGRTGW